jgi:hypothetical protein
MNILKLNICIHVQIILSRLYKIAHIYLLLLLFVMI